MSTVRRARDHPHMHILALSFTAKRTLRVEEIAGALAALAGVLLFVGAMTPLARRTGQIFGGLALAASGVLFVLAVRYGVRP
jgi:drug/metabolite transporter (DMT)-like permease